MNDVEFFKNLKNIFLSGFSSYCPDGFDYESLANDYSGDMGGKVERLLDSIRQLTERLRLAREDGDEVAMQAALMQIREHARSLSAVFHGIYNDGATLLGLAKWPEIPENYQFPE